MREVLLSTAYLPPIQYFTKIIRYERVLIEQHENYSKQSYRNRCMILGANGPLSLSVPVVKSPGGKQPVKDIKIDYATDWQKLHWKAIGSAYGKSAFYLYLHDDLKPFYFHKHTFLFDYNCKLLETLLALIGIRKNIGLTDEFCPDPVIADDFRESIHPKSRKQKNDAAFMPERYYQVFGTKHGFLPNLSIIDLLFNEGSESFIYLKKSAGMS